MLQLHKNEPPGYNAHHLLERCTTKQPKKKEKKIEMATHRTTI
jgi:hypothetical protein